MTVEARNIVSTGQPVISGKFAVTVTSWNISKESPGYALPKGQDSKTMRGVELDADGNITNGFSYVTVDISVETDPEQDVRRYIIYAHNQKTQRIRYGLKKKNLR